MIDPKQQLKELGLAPKRSFGQNFLRDQHVLDRIAEACVPARELGQSYVIEIGAGTGALTAALCKRAAIVVAIERDRDLVPLLAQRFSATLDAANDPAAEPTPPAARASNSAHAAVFRLEECDAKQAPLREWFELERGKPRVLCGNLPYQLTGFLLERAIACSDSIDRAVFLVQQEVAERLVAEPSHKEYGALTVFTAAAFHARVVLRVGPQAFYPQPQVWSAVVELVPRGNDKVEETVLFRELVKRAFHMRRKTLRNAWRGIASEDLLQSALVSAASSLDARGETLDFRQFGLVAAALQAATKQDP
jgi:16S rRNA (adenine1518-N6/adenine1519-N6)-dimethyltransferase